MDWKPQGHEKIEQLLNRGVTIPNPLNLVIEPDVNLDRIAGQGVVLYPGCRLAGAETVISPGCQLGAEGPVTVEDCQLGPDVQLRGGYFRKSVFLAGSAMGSGAQVREGCLLEEQASGAHCVGIKQTILMPFVTLGSLINFCDCLMAGGTSRRDHSEVGSAYIHFNFTPEGTKTTPSLLGDVPRGVMLRQRPIFLGGQGGMVGPLRIGYGNTAIAGTVMRRDVLQENKTIIAKTFPPGVIDAAGGAFSGLARIITNNLIYLANLTALSHWYRYVRRDFFNRQKLGPLVYAGALQVLDLARQERISRLAQLAAKMPDTAGSAGGGRVQQQRYEVRTRLAEACAVFSGDLADDPGAKQREQFLSGLKDSRAGSDNSYIVQISSLPPAVAACGTAWLQELIDYLCQQAGRHLPAFRLAC